jgi:hypothetical protein
MNSSWSDKLQYKSVQKQWCYSLTWFDVISMSTNNNWTLTGKSLTLTSLYSPARLLTVALPVISVVSVAFPRLLLFRNRLEIFCPRTIPSRLVAFLVSHCPHSWETVFFHCVPSWQYLVALNPWLEKSMLVRWEHNRQENHRGLPFWQRFAYTLYFAQRLVLETLEVYMNASGRLRCFSLPKIHFLL